MCFFKFFLIYTEFFGQKNQSAFRRVALVAHGDDGPAVRHRETEALNETRLKNRLKLKQEILSNEQIPETNVSSPP